MANRVPCECAICYFASGLNDDPDARAWGPEIATAFGALTLLATVIDCQEDRQPLVLCTKHAEQLRKLREGAGGRERLPELTSTHVGRA